MNMGRMNLYVVQTNTKMVYNAKTAPHYAKNANLQQNVQNV